MAGYMEELLSASNFSLQEGQTLEEFFKQMMDHNLTDPSASFNPSLKLFRDISAWLEHVILPIIILFGLLGNGISFLVFIFSHLRRLSASVYLAALSLANAGYLICRSIKWAHGLGVKVLLNTDSGCQTFLFLNYVFRFLSVWYVVSFTVERYIAVCQPFQRQDMCTPKRAKIVVTTLAILSLLLYSFVIWTSGVQMLYGIGECLPKYAYLQMWTFIYSVDTMSTLLVPSAAIIVLNIMIICAVYRFHRDPVRSSLTMSCRHMKVVTRTRSSSCCSRTVRPPNTRAVSSGQHSSQVKVTKMLVTVSSTFLLLNLPIHSLTVYHHIRSYVIGPGNHPSKTFIYLQRFFLLIHDSNFAVNFIIYNIWGRNFRLGLQHLINRIRYKLSRCGRTRQLNTTPATTLTLLPLNKLPGGDVHHVEMDNKLQASNGMHCKAHSRSRSWSTSSSSHKSFVSMRGRHRMTPQGSHSYRWDPPDHSCNGESRSVGSKACGQQRSGSVLPNRCCALSDIHHSRYTT